MSRPEKESPSALFTTPLEPYPGLTIQDLNRYLPAVRKVAEMSLSPEAMHEGLYLGDGLEGLRKLPTETIDLIIADPPTGLPGGADDSLSLQDYYQWNQAWLQEGHRVLKTTGALYLFTGWRHSGMYQSLLNTHFRVQTRITWRKAHPRDQSSPATWENRLSDIWFATKSEHFLFNQEIASSRPAGGPENLWADIVDIPPGGQEGLPGDLPQEVLRRILKASSYKLNWVVDPFLGYGAVGMVAKKLGRRLIAFEADQDRLLLAMKRIDHT